MEMAGIRLPGVGSGLDTDAIVSQLMAIERRPVTLLQQKSDKLKTEADAWRDLNSRLLNLQARLADLKNSSVWDSRKVTVGDSTIVTVTATSSAALANHTINSTAMAQATTWLSKRNIANPDAALNRTGVIQINSPGANNGKTISVASTESLRDIVTKINADPTLGLKAEVVQVGANFRLQVTSNVGAVNDFTLSDQSGSVAGYLQILGAGANVGSKTSTASDYTLTIDGTTYTSATATFTNVLPGLTVTVLKGSTTSTSMNVSLDDSKAVKAVKDFVDQYNSVVDFIGTLNSYDSDTKKAGTLFGEPMLQSIESALDRRITGPVKAVADQFESLGLVGVTTAKFNADETLTRKLTFDETKFKAAFAANPAAVRDLFTLNSGSDKGIAVRTEEWLKDYTKSKGLLLGKAESLDDLKKDVQDQIDRWNEVILPMKEARLRKQFSALDAAMASLQNQGSWLEQQINSLVVPRK
jgi:flagellar hook-associated protein 2